MKKIFMLLSLISIGSYESFAQQIKCKGPDCKAPLCKDLEGAQEYYAFRKGLTDKDKKRYKKSKSKKRYYQDKPFTGAIYECPEYLGGKLKYIKNWKDGVRDGDTKRWYENGKLESLYTYSEGKLIGTSYHYYENGSLQATNEYLDGNKDYILTKYDAKGNLIEKIQYKKGKRVSKD